MPALRTFLLRLSRTDVDDAGRNVHASVLVGFIGLLFIFEMLVTISGWLLSYPDVTNAFAMGLVFTFLEHGVRPG